MPDVALTITGKNLAKQAVRQLRMDLRRTSKELENTQGKLGKTGDKADKAASGLIGLTVASAMATGAAVALVRGWISAGVQMERLNLGLKAVAGTTAEARKQLVGLRKVALLPGLALPQVVKASIALQAVGVSAAMAERSLMAFGNAIATVGGGREELAGVLLALTQMSAKGKVMGQDLRQMAERLPQIRKALLDAFGTASSEELSRMGITARMFLEGVVREFEKLPPIASGAFNAIENFSDAAFQMKSALAGALLPAFTSTLNAMAALSTGIEELSATKKSIIAWGAVATTAILGIVTAYTGFLLIKPQLLASIVSIGNAFIWLASNPIGLAIVAAVALTGAIAILIKRQRSARMSAEKFAIALSDMNDAVTELRQMKTLANRLDELRKKKNLTIKETKELVRVQQELANLAPFLIAKFDYEGKAMIKEKDAITKVIEETEVLNKITARGQYIKALKEQFRLQQEVAKGRAKLLSIGAAMTKSEKGIAEGKFKGLRKKDEIIHVNNMRDRYIALGETLKTNTALLRQQIQALADYEKEYLKIGYTGIRVALPKRIKPLDLTPEQYEEETAILTREAKIQARRIEEKYDSQRALARAGTITERRELETRTKDLVKAVAEGLRTKEEEANEKNLIARTRIAYEQELIQELRDIDKDEAEEKLELAKDLEDELEDLYERRIAEAQKAADAILDIEESILKAQYSSVRSIIDLIEDRYDRQRAEADLTYTTIGRRLKDEEKAIDTTLKHGILSAKERITLENQLAQVRASIAANEAQHSGEIKKIDKERTEYNVEEEQKASDAIAKLKTDSIRRIASAYLDDESKRRAAIIVTFMETEQRLQKIVNNEKESVETRKQAASSLASLQFALLNELDKANEEFTKKREKERDRRLKEAERAARERERAAKKIRREEQETSDAWVENQKLRIALMEEGLEKKLASVKLTYEAEYHSIRSLLELEEVSDARKVELTKKLHLLQLNLAKEYKDIVLKHYSVTQAIAEQITAIPGEMIRLYMRAGELQDKAEEKITDLSRKERDRLAELRWDTEKSAAERAQLIEKIEKESAEKRLEIERDLIDKKSKLYKDYAVSFIGGILKDLLKETEQKLQKKIAELILATLPGAKEKSNLPGMISTILSSLNIGKSAAPQTATGSEGIGKFAGLLPAVVGVLSGNPFAALQALPFIMSAASFDNPYNDFRIRMAGIKEASNALGQKSASDVVSEFSKGFASMGQSSGGTPSGLVDVLASINNKLDESPEFILNIDGREVDSSVQRVRSKRLHRGNAY